MAAALAAAAVSLAAQREHTRLTPRRQTTVTESQASELTLTHTEAAVRPIQIWVRTAAVIDPSRRMLTATVPAAEAALVKPGQRVRAFSPEARSRMHQANVASVTPGTAGATVRATVMGQPAEIGRYFVLEIVTEAGEFLSVPNEAIIDLADRALVYVRSGSGYEPRDISIGIRGELYSQILSGLNAGDQVVTIGSFFIDADQKLKGQ